MVGPSYLRTLHPLQVFSLKSASSTLSSMKIKTLIHTLLYAHFCRIVRALSKAKSILIRTFKENQPIHLIPTKTTKKNYRQKKIFFGSFRLHYNWCSSHVSPVPAPVLDGFTANHLYYDSTWNSIISTSDHHHQFEDGSLESSQLSGYLQWLEEKKHDKTSNAAADQTDVNEIDRLADMFIASCHEKFRLEKQESYRRFQEMLARSV